jgi:hypothetical protein
VEEDEEVEEVWNRCSFAHVSEYSKEQDAEHSTVYTADVDVSVIYFEFYFDSC